ncbi:MAG: hypothetical protein CMC13_00230 [Flavobacteriaceae bacterium]|nr:hypothetical protein [Flavobacteriaceae bacterium]|tara:strand:- start:11100 stop:11546 length:447 start_codon:yes stop_codon:yes gene_type:complete
MEAQVITIDKKEYKVDFSYKCIKLLSEKFKSNSPVATLNRVGKCFESLISLYGDLDEKDFDKVDPEKITFEQMDMFRDLTESAINAANPELNFSVEGGDSWKLFIDNSEACGFIMASFFKHNIPESSQTVHPQKLGKQKKPQKKSKKK